jgi:hypothetical protein
VDLYNHSPILLHGVVLRQVQGHLWLFTRFRSWRRQYAWFPMRSIFSIYIILPAAIGPGVHSASNRNEKDKQKKNVFRE